ncbi:MAG TPA: ATP-binding protein [Fimbriimonas sp.]|nr:ATP-binding protein [Fimbriimonas sp.]
MNSYLLREEVIPYEINRQLKDLFPDQHILVTEDSSFDLTGFAQDGRCALWPMDDLDSLLITTWAGREKGVIHKPRHASCEILWNGHTLRCFTITIDFDQYSFVISPKADLPQRFFEAVCTWSSDADGRIVVFDGRFRRDSDLEKAIKETCWDTLVLPPEMKDRLFADVTSFFAGKETYAKYGMPWKRGVLLYGAPGNGKTHAIKALLKAMRKPCLIVRSLHDKNDTEERAIARIFKRARMTAPTVLVLEDIDSLVSKSNLSALLNELDGFALNEGLLVIATTNHLNKLDAALSNRPSRFDRKYEFKNPDDAERTTFLRSRFDRLDEAMRPSEAVLASTVEATNGFSGAMLQELVGSSAMAWMNRCQAGAMDQILTGSLKDMAPQRTAPSEAA